MSLQKMYTSRPFKAMAAFLFSLIVLTACQEAAQQVITGSAPVENQTSGKSAQQISQLEPTAEEQALATELADDPDTQFLIESSRSIYVKMKLAATTNRAELRYAMETKDGKAILKALNISDSEFKTMNEQRASAMLRWQTKFSSKRDLIQKTRDKYLPACATCKDMNTQNIDITLDRIAKTEMPAKVNELRAMYTGKELNKQAASLQACFWWWQWGLMVIAEAGCVSGFFLCLAAFGVLDVATLGILATATPWQIALCATAAAGCMASAYCGICGDCSQ